MVPKTTNQALGRDRDPEHADEEALQGIARRLGERPVISGLGPARAPGLPEAIIFFSGNGMLWFQKTFFF